MNGNWAWDGPGVDMWSDFAYGTPNAIPVVGDWNGDGKTEIGLYSNGYWYLDMNGNGIWEDMPTDTYGQFGTGLPNPVPVTGDWNGDGVTEIGIYSDGHWYLDKNSTWAWEGEPADTFGQFGMGLPNPVPVTGDWNGDGITEIGIYSNSNWYLDTNASWQWDGVPTDTYGFFGAGLANPVPVIGNW
jgi:serine-aspartate repeat-containing protein C/D/E